MKIKVIVHEAEEGGYWAEVPAIPGCATQGETFEELLKNLYEAVEGCLSVNVETPKSDGRVLEIAILRRSPGKILSKFLNVMAGNCCVSAGATTFTENPEASYAYPCLYMVACL